jgi:hypothetical protein
VRKGPALRTVRFDDPDVHVDVAGSRGVLGYLNEPALGATYVHLDGSREATIRLASAAPTTPYLERASHFTDDVRLSADLLELTTHGPGRRTFVFAGLTPGRRYKRGEEALVVDPHGRLTVALPPGQPGLLRVRVAAVAP